MDTPKFRVALRLFPLLGYAFALHAATPVRLAVVPRLAAPADAAPAVLAAVLAAGATETGFTALSGPDRPARRATTFQIGWTDAALCLTVACPLADGPAFVSRVMDRDGTVWTDDCLELFLQPAGMDGYYHFGWNPAGTQSDERGMDLSWDAPWRLQSVVTAEAWTSMVTIPFAAIGGTPAADSFWRFNLCRSDTANREYSSWSFSGGGFHRPERFGWLAFSADAVAPPATPAPPLPPAVLARVRALFFAPIGVPALRAEIATFLSPPAEATAAPLDAPVCDALRKQLVTTEHELRTIEEQFAALDRTGLAAALTGAGRLPELCRRADDTMNRWRIEQLLSAAERQRIPGDKP